MPAGYRLVKDGALQMVRNALRTDAENGRPVRGEMLAELDAVTLCAAPQAQQLAEPDQAALAVVRRFERMVGDYNCLFNEYQGKVMPDHIYQRFVALRESRIPSARNELVAMVSTALAAQQAEP